MNNYHGLILAAPRLTPVLDPFFRPAVLANRGFRRLARESQQAVPVKLALEQADGSTFHFQTEILPAGHPLAGGNFSYLERFVKCRLWSRGAFRIHFHGPQAHGEALQKFYREKPTGKFDSEIIGNRIYNRPIEMVVCQ